MDEQLTEEEQLQLIRDQLGITAETPKDELLIKTWRLNAGKSTAQPYHRMYATLRTTVFNELIALRKAITIRVGQDLINGKELIANLEKILADVDKTLADINGSKLPGVGRLKSTQPKQRLAPSKR